MTYQEIVDVINTNLTRTGTNRVSAPEIKEACLALLDFSAAIDNADAIPAWTSLITFQTDGTGAGRYCTHPDANGKKRIFETKIAGNINNEPPTDPNITSDANWEEISASAGSGIQEWAPGLYGAGLVIVYHSHTTLGRLLCILIEPVRPFNSADIEAEILTGKWDFINLPNATETVAGKVEEATDAEMTAGTGVGGTGAKLFVGPAKLLTWWNTIQPQLVALILTPSVSAGVLTILCDSRREIIAAYDASASHSIVLSNAASIDVLHIHAKFTGAIVITLPADVVCASEELPVVCTWTTGTKELSVDAGTEQLFELSLTRVNHGTGNVFKLKVSGPAL